MMHLEDSPTGRLVQSPDGSAELRVDRASYEAGGAGAAIQYSVAPSAFGKILLAATQHGVCWIGIHRDEVFLQAELRRDYPLAAAERGDAAIAPLLRPLIDSMTCASRGLELPLDLRATPFQLAVWRELCSIPRGTTRSYGAIAQRLGRPDAPRAVGHANASNPLAIVIPCHRVIGINGALTGYRWGLEIKRRLLTAEGAAGIASLLPLSSFNTADSTTVA
jgi:AraC family transcriptional regulator of adaptative response/methylated-DNA-[protein]-cysteine methyltransferase